MVTKSVTILCKKQFWLQSFVYCSMSDIQMLLRHFGFPIRDLADVLNISHSLIVMIEKGERKPSPDLNNIIADPLFSEIDTAFVAPTETDPDKTEWLKAQLAVTEGNLLLQKKKWTAHQKKYIGAQKILHHTRNLEADARKDLISDWWRWQYSKALFWLQNRKQVTEWEMERKVYLAEQNVQWLRKKILEK